MEKKLRKGSFDFEDFLAAMQQMRKLGPLSRSCDDPAWASWRAMKKLVSEKDLKRIERLSSRLTKQEPAATPISQGPSQGTYRKGVAARRSRK